MKELSIEEKDRRYDEAIKRAKAMIQVAANQEEIYNSVITIFPELKESEDERIRKAMIKYFTNGKEYLSLTPYSREDYISWLEKHGEQKPANWFQELEDKLANATPEQLAEWKDKYFKEEPAEWSEEDERLFQIVIDILDRQNHLGNISHTDLIACVRKLKSLRPQMQWRPSEKQMKWLHDAIESTQYEPRKQALVSLYSDLMELKE